MSFVCQKCHKAQPPRTASTLITVEEHKVPTAKYDPVTGTTERGSRTDIARQLRCCPQCAADYQQGCDGAMMLLGVPVAGLGGPCDAAVVANSGKGENC